MSQIDKKDNLNDKNKFNEYWDDETTLYSNPNSNKIYEKLKTKLFPSKEPKPFTANNFNRNLLYTAAIVVIAFGIFWMNQYTDRSDLIVIKTFEGENKALVLPDNSKVILLENSQISYLKSLKNNSKREVNLKGDALFTVVHNTKKPFIVTIENLVIKDIGTIFKINTILKKNNLRTIRVNVEEGSISIHEKNNFRKKIILLAGYEAIYDKNNFAVHKTIFKNTIEFNSPL
ncbi:FecR family protein [Flavobacterium sp. N502536]|uniref:FecR family protein n=1 Tax=Flavobacterium sp. N502536 TaxID=2986837 RepID=UPI002223CC3E|nr:FecR family protein [Flavobacterium sp. N502536]